jgi:hypothetical protein
LLIKILIYYILKLFIKGNDGIGRHE